MVGGECSHHCVTLAPQCRQWLESTLEHVRPLTKKNIVKNDWKTTFKEYHTWAFVVINGNHLSEITGKWHEYVQVSFKAEYCIEYFVNLSFFSLESCPYAFPLTTIDLGQFAF